ncbi:MAG: 3-phosphoshikimate 1-carboxyvinyltransferase [Bacteroidales bacterium]|nr:3-phosphoshikimate 1-carboxyvinyltransferase [Bacteroidales bacterium]
MEALHLTHPTKVIDTQVALPSSKSISNRLLIIKALCPSVEIDDLSEANDTVVLSRELKRLAERRAEREDIFTVNAEDAGTAFRFLAACLATIPGKFLLTGSERMKLRPVKPLVEALEFLGAGISYENKMGYPPIRISGGKLQRKDLTIDASISSQFISALLLVLPQIPGDDISIRLEQPSSLPYIDMTLNLIKHFGVEVKRNDNVLVIPAQSYRPGRITVEPDWSAVQYWLEMAALAKQANITIGKLTKNSMQGDAVQVEWYRKMGMNCTFNDDGMHISKGHFSSDGYFPEDFTHNPDLVPSMAVVASMSRKPRRFNGVRNLRIKETDRLEALKNELEKTGAHISFPDDDSMLVEPLTNELPTAINFNTYNDHRMAMAFAPLALTGMRVIINNPGVVRKSFPGFWAEMTKAGFTTGLQETYR